ncbi:hypothetical protein BJ684DRAFT_23198 [Piptocephalis cylindrospora]|uniref:ornithine decarboxylase n=1 Tax=Piptocephalis cylindrospora TaxID=1907219 RepID=A0A4P9Y133_9FUNG|nr:hypothetical protein BJ684DRAFT_23198 [Piptocephalis cylindrospora]|eukprot:RKP11771.1 hypothetical protein BJ684DRAFT_23198 [Piptocephalis cylindrospora]
MTITSSNNSRPQEEAFFVLDRARLRDQIRLWYQHLPTIMPFYAIKCNPEPMILEELARYGDGPGGVGFDCASAGEFLPVLATGKVLPSQIIYAHTVKIPHHLRKARELGIHKMTLDSVDEIEKIAENHPDARIVLRIRVEDRESRIRLGVKFGADEGNWRELMEAMIRYGLPLEGISFHVGSGCASGNPFSQAISLARRAFDLAWDLGLHPNLLDIGGGFPGEVLFGMGRAKGLAQFSDIAQTIRSALSRYFPETLGIRVIAEPGQFLVSGSCALVTRVLGRRMCHGPEGPTMHYHLDDGACGSFPAVLEDELPCEPIILSKLSEDRPIHRSILWGPTCTTEDLILEGAFLPEMRTGDWVFWRAMGAYTSARASTFNGFHIPPYFSYKNVIGDWWSKG